MQNHIGRLYVYPLWSYQDRPSHANLLKMPSVVIFAYHEVGVRCTLALLELGWDIRLIVSHQDDPQENIFFGSVSTVAKEHGIRVICPEDPHEPDAMRLIMAAEPDFIFSFYYRRMLKSTILDLASRGCYNMHGSLLPKYRGRAPVNWAILNGETQTGVTLHAMVVKPDAGPIVDQFTVPILSHDTAQDVFAKIVVASEILLLECAPILADGTATLRPMDLTNGSYFSGRKPDDGRISPTMDAKAIFDLVRAVTRPFPGAFVELPTGRMVIWRARLCDRKRNSDDFLVVDRVNHVMFLQPDSTSSVEILEAEIDGTKVTAENFATHQATHTAKDELSSQAATATLKIPLSRSMRPATELQYVKDALDSGVLAGSGVFTKKCESLLQTMCSAEQAFLTSSGTVALQVAALAIGTQPGDEIILPTFTYVSTVNAFAMRGATPVFVDMDEATLNIDASLIEEAITARTKAIVVVHYAGVPCDMDPIIRLAKARGIHVVEDAAQALTSKYKSRALGSIGDISCFSFHETKNVTSGGQGGAVVINNRSLLETAQSAYWNGTNRVSFMEGKASEYTWIAPGFNCQMAEPLAAILWSQLESLQDIQTKRMSLHKRYQTQLACLVAAGNITLPTADPEEHNAHLCCILVRDAKQREPLQQHLRSHNIGSAPHYPPLHSTPIGKTLGRYVTRSDVATQQAKRLLRLPLYADMTDAELELVTGAVRDFFRRESIESM